MKLVFADDSLPTEVTKTIFLAGPNPRYKNGDAVLRTWRHDVLEELERIGYGGHVFIPMPIGSFYGETVSGAVADYDHQIEWEDAAMMRADVILMWVDRTSTLRGMTTNIEFGRYLDSGRLIYGRPENADGCRYLDEQIKKRRKEAYSTITAIVKEADWRLRDGAERTGGEVLVPLVIWNSKQFQDWYTHMFSGDSQGNELRGFDIKTILCFSNRRSKITDERSLFGFAAHVNIWVEREQREKSNEWIFSRTATSYVVPFYIDPKTGEYNYVLIREFRSPANNTSGYVYEFPGGSAPDESLEPLENAKQELKEETSIDIEDVSRFFIAGKRQTFATFSTNTIFTVGIQLTKEEFEKAKQLSRDEVQLGADDGERIKLFIATEKEILRADEEDVIVDWSSIGMMTAVKHGFQYHSAASTEQHNPLIDDFE